MQLTEEHEQLRNTVSKFVQSDINPHVDEWEKAEQFPAHEVFAKLGDLGLLGVKYDPDCGGLGLDFSYSMVMAEALGEVSCGGVPMAIGVQTDMCTPALNRFGSDELKQEFLAPAIAGRMVGCIGVSEAGGGSDVAAIKTQAVVDGDDYVINGSKMWITNGMQADWCCLLANTSDGAVHKNKSLIMVPLDSKGVERQKIHKIGMHSSDTAQLFFDNVRVPRRNPRRPGGHGLYHADAAVPGRASVVCGLCACRPRPADRSDHRLHARAQGLRQVDPRQPRPSISAFQNCAPKSRRFAP